MASRHGDLLGVDDISEQVERGLSACGSIGSEERSSTQTNGKNIKIFDEQQAGGSCGQCCPTISERTVVTKAPVATRWLHFLFSFF